MGHWAKQMRKTLDKKNEKEKDNVVTLVIQIFNPS